MKEPRFFGLKLDTKWLKKCIVQIERKEKGESESQRKRYKEKGNELSSIFGSEEEKRTKDDCREFWHEWQQASRPI